MAGPGRPKSIDDTKFFDVAKPNKAKPVGTSRPVIINHAEGVADGTIKDPNAKPLTAPSVSRKVISPISVTDSAASSEETKKSAEKSTITIIPEPADDTNDSVSVKKKAKTVEAETPSETDPEVTPEPAADPEAETETEKVEEATPEVPAEPTQAAEKETMDELAENPSEALVDENTTSDEEKSAAMEPEVTPDTTDKQEDTPSGPAADASTTEDTAKPAEQESPSTEADKSEEAPMGSDAASVDALAEASEGTKVDQKAEEEQAKRDAELQSLIDSKKYFVPLAHDSTKTSKKGGLVWALILLLAIAAGGYYALDAQIIKNNITLPFEIFK